MDAKISGYGARVTIADGFTVPFDGSIFVSGRVPAGETQTIYINIGGVRSLVFNNIEQAKYYTDTAICKKGDTISIAYNTSSYEPAMYFTPLV